MRSRGELGAPSPRSSPFAQCVAPTRIRDRQCRPEEFPMTDEIPTLFAWAGERDAFER